MFVVAVATVVVSGFSAYRRFQVETSNRATELAAEYETIEALAAGQGQTVDAALDSLKAQGLTSVVLAEESIGEMISEGSLTLETTSIEDRAAQVKGSPPVQISALRFNDKTLVTRVQKGLAIRFGSLVANTSLRGDLLALPSVSASLVRQVGIGLPTGPCEAARRHGLAIIARTSNPLGLTDTAATATLTWLRDSGARVLLPLGDQVMGRREGLPNTLTALRSLGLLYATSEFTKLGGDVNIVTAAPDLIVRLHSAQVAELDRLTNPDAVERYVKAARERNMRVLLVRPLTLSGPQPLTSYGAFLKSIGDGIRREGGEIGRAKAYTEPNLPRVVILLLGALGAVLTFGLIQAISANPRIRLAGAGFATVLAGATLTKTGIHVNALVVSMVFPLLGFLALDGLDFPTWPNLVRIPAAFALVSAFSVAGGLYVAGLLNGLAYYIKADEFLGIKVSVFVPILVVGAIYAVRWTDWRQTLAQGITWGTALLGVVLAAVLGFMLARTGNDSGVGASGGEMLFRSFLEQILYVRPRTKEFLVGHPAMFVALGMYFRYVTTPLEDSARLNHLRGWTILAFVLGAVGQTDIVNTLCHLHIPVALSLVRVTLGIALGCIVGSALWAVVAKLIPPAQAAGQEKTIVS